MSRSGDSAPLLWGKGTADSRVEGAAEAADELIGARLSTELNFRTRFFYHKQYMAGVDTQGPIAFIYAHWAFKFQVSAGK